MSTQKTIALIGGTGKAGKYILNELLAKQYRVRLLARDPFLVPKGHPLVEIIKGDARDFRQVYNLIKPCHAVVSALGQTRGVPEPMFIEGMRAILKAMDELALTRLIMVLGLNLDVAGDQKTPANLAATAWMRDNYPVFSAEKQKIVAVLAEYPALNWTVVRIPFLVEQDDRTGVVSSLVNCLGERVYGPDLAGFVVEELDRGKFLKKYPFVSSK